MSVILLFLFVAALQTGLIYYQHFSPFERESNLRAVLWGAKPAPRYWAVLVLDVLTGLLLWVLILGILPMSPGDSLPGIVGDAPLLRLLRTLPLWVIVSLLAAVLYSYINNTIIRFPNYGLIARRMAVALVLGVVLIAATLFLVLAATTRALDFPAGMWAALLIPGVLIPALILAVFVFMVRALAFFLRVIPVIGSFLNAAASTLALVSLFQSYAQMFSTQMLGIGGGPGVYGLEGVALLLAALALITLVAVWKLPGAEKHAEAVEPPPLVIRPASDIPSQITISDAGAAMVSRGIRIEVTRTPFGLAVKNAPGDTLLQLAERGLASTFLLQKIVSIPLLYTGNTIKCKLPPFSVPIDRVYKIESENGTLAIHFTDKASRITHYVLRIAVYAPDIIRMTVETTRRSYLQNALSLSFASRSGEHYLGLGQQFNKVDQRGEEIYLFVEEGGVGYEWACRRWPFIAPLLRRMFGERGSFPNGPHCTGFPVPFALFAREHGPTTGLFWDTYRPSWFRAADERRKTNGHSDSSTVLRPSSSVSTVTVLTDRLDLYLCVGPTATEAIQQYTSLIGRSALPPPWAFLPWKTRTGPVTEADTLEDIHRFRELRIPLAHVGIEHWQNIRGSYEFSPEWYPHIDELIHTARENGMRITVWHLPYMNAGSATHREGMRKGYFLRNRLGLPYQQRIFHGVATVVDYTNPRGAAWHEAIVQRAFYKRGLQGAMTDYAESVPPDCVMYNGQSGLVMRNAYPVMYCESMLRAVRGVHGDDHILYPRAGYAGSQRFVNIQWPGDQDTDWDDGDGLPAAVRAMLNVSMCGFPVHGSDIGGWYDWFSAITTKELYLRWAEVGTYSPLMRAHGGPIGRNREPWKFDDETVEIYRALSEEHVKLFPYLYSLSRTATENGTPIIRHPALIWSDCAELYGIEDAWMMGGALYVAPVIRPGITEREVILPPGEWWDLNENRALTGPMRLKVHAPFGRVPLFLRRGFALPRFQKAFDTFDPAPNGRIGHLDDNLEAWLYPGNGRATFALFDGTTLTQGDTSIGKRQVTWRLFG